MIFGQVTLQQETTGIEGQVTFITVTVVYDLGGDLSRNGNFFVLN